ncbi:aa3-type cytochrome c oxidase subunit IV [Abyssibius alkaniclasticus]
MSAHEHGTMNTDEQEKTFAGFIKVGIWTIYICIGIAVFLAVFNA